MARNEVFRDAERLTLPVASGVKSGDPVLVGSLPGVAQTDRDADGNATVWMKGAHRFTVTGVTAIGGPVYITSGGALNVTPTSNTLYGYALEVTASGATPCIVKLAQV